MLTVTTVRRAIAVLASILLVLVIVLLTGCSAQLSGDLGHLQDIAKGCTYRPLNSFVQYDGTGSSNSDEIEQTRLAVIKSIAERTAVCGGQLTVTVFSSSSGTTTPVFSGDLTTNAPTDNARYRKVGKTVASVMDQISAKIGPAISALPGGGSDITSTYRLMGEQAAQFPNMRFESYLLTDGMSNVGITITGPLAPEDAQELAAQVDAPRLPSDSSVNVIGLGHVVGDPVPSNVIEGLVSLYDAICARTGSAHCLSVTDWK